MKNIQIEHHIQMVKHFNDVSAGQTLDDGMNIEEMQMAAVSGDIMAVDEITLTERRSN